MTNASHTQRENGLDLILHTYIKTKRIYPNLTRHCEPAGCVERCSSTRIETRGEATPALPGTPARAGVRQVQVSHGLFCGFEPPMRLLRRGRFDYVRRALTPLSAGHSPRHDGQNCDLLNLVLLKQRKIAQIQLLIGAGVILIECAQP
jgi:hypothetical protein